MSSYPWAAGYIDDGDRPKLVTSRFEHEDSYTLERYHATGGYAGLRAALGRTPAEVHDEVRGATVLGRGGAGFPAGVKWGLMPAGKYPRYLVVNGDESEPGTYKDRLLMERDPHQLVEGCLIAAYAAGLSQVFLYIRGEMPLAHERVAVALNDAYAAGYVGKNILGTNFSVDIVLHWGAGAYVVGEETALIESLEGKRGEPRLKPLQRSVSTVSPPSSTTSRRCPTCRGCSSTVRRPSRPSVLPPARAPAWSRCRGTWSGPVCTRSSTAPPPFATCSTATSSARAPGGGSAPWFTPEQLDLPFQGKLVGAAGSMLGSGAIMVMDHTTDIPTAALTLTRFYAAESCGQCTPCREGGTWLERVLQRVVDGRGTHADLAQMMEIGESICPGAFPHAASERLGLAATPFPYKMTTICFVGPSAYAPVHSALTLFRDEFEAKIVERRHIPVSIEAVGAH